MAATATLPTNAPANLRILPPWAGALLAGLTVLTGAVVGILNSFNVVHWTPAQTTLVGTEVAAFWACAAAVAAHVWPKTQKQPVAVAGTVTALVSTTLSLGIGFAWWHLTQAQNASLIGLVTAIVAVASAVAARSAVTPVTPVPVTPNQPNQPNLPNLAANAGNGQADEVPAAGGPQATPNHVTLASIHRPIRVVSGVSNVKGAL